MRPLRGLGDVSGPEQHEADGYLDAVVLMGRAMDPLRAQRWLRSGLRTLTHHGHATAERIARLVNELNDVLARMRDTRRN